MTLPNSSDFAASHATGQHVLLHAQMRTAQESLNRPASVATTLAPREVIAAESPQPPASGTAPAPPTTPRERSSPSESLAYFFLGALEVVSLLGCYPIGLYRLAVTHAQVPAGSLSFLFVALGGYVTVLLLERVFGRKGSGRSSWPTRLLVCGVGANGVEIVLRSAGWVS